MIISRTHRYLFIEVPHTASTALSKELRELYGGEEILYKHATYNEFYRRGSKDERSYFVFAGVRNPMDDAVSMFFKFKTNHKENFTTPAKFAENGGWVTEEHRRQFEFVRMNNADFPSYFRQFFKNVYLHRFYFNRKDYDMLLRYEKIDEDLTRLLNSLGVQKVRPLPVVNKTRQKDRTFEDYFTPEIRQQAVDIFGPFMAEHGYSFPPTWGMVRISDTNQREYRALTRTAALSSSTLRAPFGVTSVILSMLRKGLTLVRRIG